MYPANVLLSGIVGISHRQNTTAFLKRIANNGCTVSDKLGVYNCRIHPSPLSEYQKSYLSVYYLLYPIALLFVCSGESFIHNRLAISLFRINECGE